LVSFGGVSGGFRADTCLWRVYLYRYRDISRLQTFEAYFEVIQFGFVPCFYPRFHSHTYINHFIINILIFAIMTQVHLLFANKSYDAAKQAVEKNQIIQMNGYDDDRYVVYDITGGSRGLIYRLINLRTRKFGQCDLIRPLSEKFGIGYYFDDANPEFMDAYEVAILHSEAEENAHAEQEEQQRRQERNKQLEAIGRERLETIVPDDVKAVIIAELHKDNSEPMSDYYGYSTGRTVILGFSNHTKDLFSEMRKYAVNFEETTHLAEANEKYEHREKYTGGAGYYPGESKYSGWVVKKEKYYRDRDSIIDAYALIAGDEANICVKVQEATSNTPDTVAGDFVIVDYSEKALAIFGDTRPIKDQLKALGGRFNPKLTHEGGKQAGWIFSKSKEQEIRNLLAIK
jgi:hypothetical protein